MTWHNEAVYDSPVIAELYDSLENGLADVHLIRKLLNSKKRLHILEPFCGTGRILLPLAQDGHLMTGFDQAPAMIALAKKKAALLGEVIQARATLYQGDVLKIDWPGNYDVVILGGNCLYELASAEQQEKVIACAAGALKPGGCVYVDNDHMEGDLAASWRETGVKPGFPNGRLRDGTRVESTIETVWFDAPARLVRFHRRTTAAYPDGRSQVWDFIQQKHPVSTAEVGGWLEKYGFVIEQHYADREASPYTSTSPRSIFWARKDP
jgi:SAM-dependent methyltransferase